MSPSALFAACASPTGNAGSLNWNGTAFQYCDGTNWQSFSGGSSYDTTPDTFTFTDVTGQNLNAVVTSNTLTITGLTTTIPVLATVSGSGNPQISVGGGAWATSAVLFNGQTIAVRHTTPSTSTTARTATVTIGSGSDTWQTTTAGVTPGSQTYSSAGTYTFTVPAFNTLTVTVKGAGSGGGGGGASCLGGYGCYEVGGSGGNNGGNSSFNANVIGGGGTSSNGTASGGDTNTTGGGSAGGSGGSGNGASYGYGTCSASTGANGKPGGMAVKAYTTGQLTGGGSITVVVGAGGSGGGGGSCSYGYGSINGNSGSNGTVGNVAISWN